MKQSLVVRQYVLLSLNYKAVIWPTNYTIWTLGLESDIPSMESGFLDKKQGWENHESQSIEVESDSPFWDHHHLWVNPGFWVWKGKLQSYYFTLYLQNCTSRHRTWHSIIRISIAKDGTCHEGMEPGSPSSESKSLLMNHSFSRNSRHRICIS